MLQPGLVVHDDIVVAERQAVHRVAQDAVGRAVAALALRPAHGQQVKALLLNQGIAHAVFDEVGLGHAAAHVAGLHLDQRFFAHVADGLLKRNAQSQVEVRAGIGVDRQHRAHVV